MYVLVSFLVVGSKLGECRILFYAFPPHVYLADRQLSWLIKLLDGQLNKTNLNQESNIPFTFYVYSIKKKATLYSSAKILKAYYKE